MKYLIIAAVQQHVEMCGVVADVYFAHDREEAEGDARRDLERKYKIHDMQSYSLSELERMFL